MFDYHRQLALLFWLTLYDGDICVSNQNACAGEMSGGVLSTPLKMANLLAIGIVTIGQA